MWARGRGREDAPRGHGTKGWPARGSACTPCPLAGPGVLDSEVLPAVGEPSQLRSFSHIIGGRWLWQAVYTFGCPTGSGWGRLAESVYVVCEPCLEQLYSCEWGCACHPRATLWDWA